ncbi:MAG TPA: hypothetical protein VG711_02070 [Phycisphaerales bacterium]|nr:hypothetical protein [Phycisphaerales bacterium]
MKSIRPFWLGLVLATVTCVGGCATPSAFAINSKKEISWVTVGADGKLVYRQDERGNRVPDFTAVGYEGHDVEPPSVEVREMLEPSRGETNAKTKIKKYPDDTQRIQDAVDRVCKLPMNADGFRGAVLLRRGVYRIEGTVSIWASGVVLRGEGDGEGGTRLIATGQSQRTLIEAGGQGGARMNPRTETQIVDTYVPVGAMNVHVDKQAATMFSVGDEVNVRRPCTEEWVHFLGMDKIKQVPGQQEVRQWGSGTAELNFRRVITSIDGGAISLDAPITCALEERFGGGVIGTYEFPGRIEHIGIENLSADSEYRSQTDEEHAWTCVRLEACRDAWVRDVTTRHFGMGTVLVDRGASRVTIERCKCLDPISQIEGSRRYSFYVLGQQTLVRECRSRRGRHDFVTGGRVCGPNVFVDCVAEQAYSDEGPHERWAVGTLYDNISVTGNSLNVINRGGSGSGQGWAGAWQVLWTCRADEIVVDQAPGSLNWCFGARSRHMSGDGVWEAAGRMVKPRSLYEQQAKERRRDK